MKKIISIVLLFICVLAFSGCDEKESDNIKINELIEKQKIVDDWVFEQYGRKTELLGYVESFDELLGNKHLYSLCRRVSGGLHVYVVEFESHKEAIDSLKYLESKNNFEYKVYKNILFIDHQVFYEYLDNYTIIDGIMYSADMKNLVKIIDCPNILVIKDEVESISQNAFAETKIKKVIFNDEMKRIGYGAFKDCNYLETVELNKGLEIIDSYAFHNTIKMEYIIIPNTVQFINYNAFNYGNIFIIKKSKPTEWHYHFCSDISVDGIIDYMFDAKVYWSKEWGYDDNNEPFIIVK